MHVYGQLLHVEEFNRDGMHYRIAVFRVQGGLHGKWSCDSCSTDDNHDRTHPNREECVAFLKRAIDEHHCARHAQAP